MNRKERNPCRAGSVGPINRGLASSPGMAVALALMLVTVAWAADNRTALEPGWNMFSPQQDVEIGQQVSGDAERELPVLDNSRVDNYVNSLGQRLSTWAPGENYPYIFKVVNEGTINAFALPGGPVYINRGVIEAADNESQLAGVIAHEVAHVALRHGTNQASKASAAQLPLAILGGILGSSSTEAALVQLGSNFAVNSILLKYSRTAESQADIMATQILFDAGYDPRAMAQFFEKIEEQQGDSGPVEFFSNHPSPDNRIERVNQEVSALGGVPRDSRTNSSEFDEVKRYLQTVPGPDGRQLQARMPGGAPELLIMSASYGADGRFIDVRQRMQSRVQNDRLDLKVTNSSMGGDPISQSKTLQVRYRWNDRDYDVTVRENQQLSIPTGQEISDTRGSISDRPSGRFVSVENSVLRINHPENWQVYGQGDAMTITPRGGLVDDGQGNQALAYGVIVNLFEPSWYGYGQQLQGPGFGQGRGGDDARLEQSTDQLVQELRLSNRNMRVVRYREVIRVDGDGALSTYFSNDSPLGGLETVWLVTVDRPDGLLFMVFTAPEQEFRLYEGTFHEMLRSVRITR